VHTLVVFVVVVVFAVVLMPALARAEGKDLDGVVNLNTATADLLQLLPGIGPAKVRSIYWYRQRHPFRTIDELVRIKGIGRKMVRHLRSHLAVSGPSTARAVRRPIPLEPLPAPVPSPAPVRAPIKRPPVPVLQKGRPPPGSTVREHHARANHCARPR
jgi:competence ComEA-like helix-hairpin-helix protein